MSTRRTLPAAVVLLLLAASCSDAASPQSDGQTPPSPAVTDSPPVETATGFGARMACSLPKQWLLRIYRGYDAKRSAELQILPRVPNFVGSGLPHVGPWSFTSEVPMFWYGPGYIKPIGPVQEPVTAADIAATQAHLLGSSFQAPDGEPMLDGLVPEAERAGPPRLVVVMVWDGAGRAVLGEWPDAWPNLSRLRSQGAWYERATVGSSPTSSAQIHASIGTGAFPRTHKVVGHYMRAPDGEIVSPWKDGPGLLPLQTFADAYDREMGNRPLVGISGTVPIQLGMMSRGAFAEGGDKDLAILRVPGQAETLGAEGNAWNLPQDFDQWYGIPPYVNDFPGLPAYFDDVNLDAGDGQRDGLWHGHAYEESEELLDGFHTPARVPLQTRVIEEFVAREGFGDDEVPDLLYINYKLIDALGHIYGAQGLEMRDAIASQDRYLRSFIDFLNEEVGTERWVLLVTADHGSLKSAETTGAFQISAERLHGSIQEEFDTDGDDVAVVDQVKQTEIFINLEELAEQDATLDDVARFVMTLRQEDLPIPGLAIPDPEAKVFQAAFPSSAMEALPCLDPDASE